jgi:hypothetical protein
MRIGLALHDWQSVDANTSAAGLGDVDPRLRGLHLEPHGLRVERHGEGVNQVLRTETSIRAHVQIGDPGIQACAGSPKGQSNHSSSWQWRAMY